MSELIFDTDWPWWAFAIAGVAAAALVLRFYRFERKEVGWGRGGVLTLLRLLLVALVLLMFAQPVLRTWQDRRYQRGIAVLVDESASMRIPRRAGFARGAASLGGRGRPASRGGPPGPA